MKLEATVRIRHGGAGRGVVVPSPGGIHVADHGVGRRVGRDLSAHHETGVVFFHGKILDLGVRALIHPADRAAEHRMCRQLETVGECQEGSLAFLSEVLSVSPVPGPHQGRPEGLAFIRSLPVVRKTERVPQLVAHATDEDGVVAPQRNVAILTVANLGLRVGQALEVQNRRVHLPRVPAPVSTPGIVRTVLADRCLVGIPVRHVAEDHQGLVPGIDPSSTQGGKAFIADLATRLHIIRGIVLTTGDGVNAKQAIVGVVETDRTRSETQPLHFPRIEVLDVL